MMVGEAGESGMDGGIRMAGDPMARQRGCPALGASDEGAVSSSSNKHRADSGRQRKVVSRDAESGVASDGVRKRHGTRCWATQAMVEQACDLMSHVRAVCLSKRGGVRGVW